MSDSTNSLTCKIDKKHVAAMATFAINNIPGADKFTLQKFLELMNTTGSFGPITVEQLIQKMSFMLKYIPETCGRSLLILVELLDIYVPVEVENVEVFRIDPD